MTHLLQSHVDQGKLVRNKLRGVGPLCRQGFLAGLTPHLISKQLMLLDEGPDSMIRLSVIYNWSRVDELQLVGSEDKQAPRPVTFLTLILSVTWHSYVICGGYTAVSYIMSHAGE